MQAAQALRRVEHHRLPQRRRGLRVADAGPVDQCGEGARVAHGVLVGEDDRRPNHQRQVQLQRGDVERHGGDREHPVVAGQPGVLAHGRQEVVQVGPRDLHALRAARRAGGVDRIREVLRITHHSRVFRAFRGEIHRVEDQPLRGVRRRYLGALIGHQDRGDGVAQDVRQPFRRVGRVDRQVRRTGLRHGQQCHQQFRRPGQRHRHDRLGVRTDTEQVVGQPVGALVELPVTEPLRCGDERGRLRPFLRTGLEQLRERLVGNGAMRVVPGE